MKQTTLPISMLVLGALGGALTFSFCNRGPVAPPTFAGQPMEESNVKIDFNRFVDIYLKPYSGDEKNPRIFKHCKIIGVIGEGAQINRSSLKGYRSFKDWICVEFKDGRRAYTPKSDIEYFVDSEPATVEESSN